MSLFTFRDSFLRYAPPWLQRAWGSRLIYTFGLHDDALIDMAVAAVKLRFPEYCLQEAVETLATERQIMRGPSEDEAAFIDRLVSWLDERKLKGNPYTLIRQIQAYLSPNTATVKIVNNGGMWHWIDASGDNHFHYAGNWNWDDEPTWWARYWVVIHNPTQIDGVTRLWERETTFSEPSTFGAVFGEESERGMCVGSTIPLHVAASLKQLAQRWSPAHATCRYIIVAFDDDTFSPTGESSGLPDGTWAKWGKTDENGWTLPSREPTARYISVRLHQEQI